MSDCQRIRENLEELALHDPFAPLDAQVQRHLDGCAACRRELRETQEAWLTMAAALPQQPVSSEFTASLLERIRPQQEKRLAEATDASDLTRLNAWRYVLAASVLIALAAATFALRGRDDGSNNVAQNDLATIQEIVDQINKLRGVVAGPRFRYASFRTTGDDNAARAYLVFDAVANQAHFFASGLPEGDEQFVLWLLDEDGNVAGKSLVEVNAQRLGSALIDLSQDASPLAEAIVSREANAAAESPSDDTLLRSTIEPPR